MAHRENHSTRRGTTTPIAERVTADEVARLAGRTPNRGGYILCPIHADNSPSLHLLERGYFCFGCGAKGGLLDLAVALGAARDRASAARWLEERIANG
jgi:hypothetical protein